MIDKNKMQIEILKDLLSPRSSCRLIFVSDDEVAITEGGTGYVYAKDGMGNLVGLFLPMRVKEKF